MDENEELNHDWKYKMPLPDKKYRYKGKVVLYYGPYPIQHSTEHLPEKLRGLKDLLVREGYSVVIAPWYVYDRMAVVFNGNLLFTSRYSPMDFDGFGQDPLTKEAFRVTIDALNRNNGWYLMKNFKEKNPMDFFCATVGK